MLEKQIIWNSTDESVNIKQIEKIEKILEVKFPKEYINCVIKHNGGNIPM